MTGDHTLPDFHVVLNTTNSHRNMGLVSRRRMKNENYICSEIGSKYQTFDFLQLDGIIVYKPKQLSEKTLCSVFQPLYNECSMPTKEEKGT